MQISEESLIIIIVGILSPIVTLLLGWWQRRNESKRVPAQNIVDFSAAAESIGNSWNTLLTALEEEIRRVRQQCTDREKELLYKLEILETNLGKADKTITVLREENEVKYKKLLDRILELEDGINSLVKQIEDSGNEPIYRLNKEE